MKQPKGARKLLVGVDEAGYGPNLGPLLIGGSAWLVPEGLVESDFCTLFSDRFRPTAWSEGCDHIPLGDSKKLYQSGSGLRTLEIGLLAMLSQIEKIPVEFDSLVRQLCGVELGQPSNPPWYQESSLLKVPSIDSLTPETKRLSQFATATLNELGIELVACRAMVITEPDFNERVELFGSKGLLLSKATFALVSQLLEGHPTYGAEIYCDRQGGRKNYLPLLLEWMPDSWFVEVQQSTERCSYRTTVDPTIEIHFTIGGDSFPPTALASMVAKYLRERFMEAFNCYWAQHCPGIKPTAGYPQDALRFRQTIESVAMQQSLDEACWWRQR